MHILWHLEFHVDYSRFPAIDWNEEKEVAPAVFSEIPKQCKAYELWRRRQSVECNLHIYQSHFADFAKFANTLPQDFFDFRVNILERRHQAFLEWQQREAPLVLLSPGVILSLELDIAPFTEEALQKKTLVSIAPKNETGELSGLWVIPPDVQKVFCSPLTISTVNEYKDDDLGYWWGLAKKVNEPIILESEFLSNYLPQYSTGSRLHAPIIDESETTIPDYQKWSKQEFIDWMAKQTFRFAKTMRWCPHEYIILRNYDSAGQREYLMAIDYLHRNAVVDVWRDRFQFAVFEDGHKYWYCGVIDLLNRTSRELEMRIFKEDGKDEHGRKIVQG